MQGDVGERVEGRRVEDSGEDGLRWVEVDGKGILVMKGKQ